MMVKCETLEKQQYSNQEVLTVEDMPVDLCLSLARQQKRKSRSAFSREEKQLKINCA